MGCHWAPSEHLTIIQEIILMAGEQKADGYSISRAAGGDYFVSGSVHSVEGEAWAARMGSTGSLRWEYRYRPFGNTPITIEMMQRKERESRFFDVVSLADNKTLLCGMKTVGKRPTAFLVFLDAAGKFVEERELIPHENGYSGGLRCLKWGNGVAIVSGLNRAPRGIGWLTKLDDTGNFVWEKYGNAYGTGDIKVSGTDLLMISWEGGSTQQIVGIDSDGNVRVRHPIPDGSAYFMHPVVTSSNIRIAVMLLGGQSTILDFDRDLRGPIHTVTVNNAGIKKGYELQDGSTIIFGSTIGNNATASITRVYGNTSSRQFVLKPEYLSSWINDAVPSDQPHEFVTVRQLSNGNSVIAWISVKPR
jgi:hypothetical protein